MAKPAVKPSHSISKYVLRTGASLALMLLGACAGNRGTMLPVVTPTIYYKPVIEASKETCSLSDKQSMLNDQGDVLARVCKKSYDNCKMQGSCVVVDEDGNRRSLNFDQVKGGHTRWIASKSHNSCPYGLGVQNICLDPFFSVAADPQFHLPGEVIFVPKLVGLILPDGAAHNGYLIVRDQGGAIQGENRFDFFTGFLSPYDSENPFAKFGLGDTSKHFGYQVVNEDVAEKVRESRNYPGIP